MMFEKGNSRYTTVSADNTLTLSSGNDTTLKGAQVQGRKWWRMSAII
ncbi:hemagglutinin repeat-containing protein [Edwardsiella anguillarum]|nr:hemagglutinin repeat-containing protein [Edwardsiella anguillarum]